MLKLVDVAADVEMSQISRSELVMIVRSWLQYMAPCLLRNVLIRIVGLRSGILEARP